MTNSSHVSWWSSATVAALTVCAAIAISATAVADGNNSHSRDAKLPSGRTSTKTKATKKMLTGAELYAINCNRCHTERYPTEFNSAEWKTLMTHMRVRANLPAAQATAILKYLQEESGS
jgi:mono/diheme cytochrome c family protein